MATSLRTAGWLALAALALGACANAGDGPRHTPDAHAVEVERTLYRHTVDFPSDAVSLPAGDRDALLAFLRETGADRTADVLVTVPAGAGADGPAQARRIAVMRVLRRYGFNPRRPDPLTDVHDGGGDVRVRVARYHAVLPDCPNLARTTTSTYTNLPASNFGCATHRNLGLMVANPRDLLRGQEMGPTSGARAAKGVERYYRGDRWIPTDSDGSGGGGTGGGGGEE